MDELLLALERTRRSGRGWRIASAAVLVAGAAWVVANPGPEPCKDVAASLHNVWNDDARTRIEQAVSGTGNTSAAARIQSLVDVYAGQWSEMRVESCMATHRGEQSPQVLDRRMRCLDERLTELRTSLEVVTQNASQEQQQGLIDIIAGLPMLDGCANVAWLETAQPGDPPAEFAEDSQTLWEGVATMEAQLRGGQQRDAKVLARELVATAERISDARARAKVLALVGSIEAGDEVFETARAKLHDAFYTAGAVGLDDLCVTIACDIANFEAYEDPKQAEQWHRHANTALQRGRLAGSSTEAYFEHSVGIRRSVAGDRAEAVEHFERALSLWKAVGAEDHAEASATHRSLGLALSALQRRDEARHHLERAYELRSQTFGEAHTATISSRIALGQLDHDEGRYEEAIVQLEAALRSAEQAQGRNHVKVADICNNISSPLLVLQRTAPAIAYLERAQGIYAALPAHKDDLAMVAFNLGNLFGAEQRFEDAKASYERAATSWEEVWGASDSRTLRARIGSALVLADLGEPRLAQQRVETIIPLFEMKRDGPGLLAEMQGVLADLSFRAGDVTRARAAIEEGRRLAALDPEGTKAILEYFDELLREHAP